VYTTLLWRKHIADLAIERFDPLELLAALAEMGDVRARNRSPGADHYRALEIRVFAAS